MLLTQVFFKMPFYGILWGCTHVLCGFPTPGVTFTSVPIDTLSMISQVPISSKLAISLSIALKNSSVHLPINECFTHAWKVRIMTGFGLEGKVRLTDAWMSSSVVACE